MANIAVTGCLGYLGVATSTALHRAGHDVVGLDTGEHARVDELSAVPVIEADVKHYTPTNAALSVADADAVVHLAAIPGVDACADHPVAAARVNIEGSRHVATWCRVNEAPLVLASTVGVYHPGCPQPYRPGRPRRPPHFYGQTKRAAEDVLEACATPGAPAAALEMTNLYGQYDVGGETVEKAVAANFFVDRALAGEPIPVHRPGWQARDFLHVLDAADAYVRAVEQLLGGDVDPFTRLVVGGEDPWTVRGVAEHVAEATGATVELVENPADGPYYDGFDVDVSAARDWLGWSPERRLEDLIGAAVRSPAD